MGVCSGPFVTMEKEKDPVLPVAPETITVTWLLYEGSSQSEAQHLCSETGASSVRRVEGCIHPRSESECHWTRKAPGFSSLVSPNILALLIVIADTGSLPSIYL